MTDEQNSYRQIMKATSIFGGVQVFNIIISFVRGKALALLIGPAGMGLNGLFISGLNLISTASGLGIAQSAVRDISVAHASGDRAKINRTFTVFRRWIWITALLGAAMTILFAPLLSRFSFKSSEHNWSFVLLSSTFIFGALAGGIYTLLRGTMKIKALAQANILGSLAGLLVALPVFYFFGIRGVVPAIILTSFAGYLVSLYFRRKVVFEKVAVSFKETIREGGTMVKLGISLSLSTLMGTATSYILNAFIARSGDLTDLGLYSAGMTIVGSYVGMVFTAMGTDYFPRLSGVIHDENKWKLLVNQQAEIVILILGPVLTLLLATAPILVRILLSTEFLTVIDFLTWASIGILVKGVVWVVGFILLASGNNKLFFITETIANIVLLVITVFLFSFCGLKGTGIAYLLSYLLVFMMMILVVKANYKFMFNNKVYILLFGYMIFVSLSVLCIIFLKYPTTYYIGAFLSAASLLFSLYVLNKRIRILDFLKTKLLK